MVNVLLDVLVFSLPIQLFRGLSLEWRQKFGLIAPFLLCLSATILGVVKIAQIQRIAYGDGDSTVFCILNALEANVGVRRVPNFSSFLARC